MTQYFDICIVLDKTESYIFNKV